MKNYNNLNLSGSYDINLNGIVKNVKCDMVTNGGGWMEYSPNDIIVNNLNVSQLNYPAASNWDF